MQNNFNDLNLRSEEVQEILTRVPHWMIRWGNIILIIILLIVMLFSYLIEYPDLISTNIVITTQNPPEKLTARTTGKISRILVHDRMQVLAATPLAIIDNSANYLDVFRLKTFIDSTSINTTSFDFPFNTLGILELGEIQNSFTNFEKDYLAYDLNRDFKPHSVEKNAQSSEAKQLIERLVLMQQQYKISENELQLKQQELDRYRKLYEKGIIASQEWETRNFNFLQSEKNLRSIGLDLSQMRSSINDLRKNSANTKINESKDNINLLRNVLQSFNQLKKAISDWELTYVLTSSTNGTVSFMQIWVENQTINLGEQVFIIVPKDTKNYIGKVKAPAQSSGKIQINQDVNIRLLNFPDSEFGIIQGKVKSISLSPDKDGDILIDISLPYGMETSFHKKIVFQQEMSGTADIVTEDLRLIERLLYQFRDIFKR